MINRMHAAGAVAVAALALSACGDDGADSTTTPEPRSPTNPAVAVTGTDELAFEPVAFEMTAGEQTTVDLTAQAGVEHDLVIADAADVGSIAEEGEMEMDMDSADDLHVAHADAGQTTSATVTIDEAGTYEVYCSIPGHREAGMTATLTVT